MNHFKRMKRWLGTRGRRLATLDSRIDDLAVLIGRLSAERQAEQGILGSIQDAEFKVFSQFGEDGILQYLVRTCGIMPEERIFVEFGVETYDEANTRFLLHTGQWSGLVIDGSKSNIAAIHNSDVVWRHGVEAIAAFIDRDNIDELISSAGISGRIGILSIDIDGNDYWVWERIRSVDPVIVVAEYNSVFGPDRAVSVPYSEDFVRNKAHHSNLYWGCSIQALAHLAGRKGYALVGSNSAGNNAFFVRRERLNGLSESVASNAYVCSHFRESRDRAGNLTWLHGIERRRLIRHLPLVDVTTGETLTVGDL
jgi:hypothetical protein